MNVINTTKSEFQANFSNDQNIYQEYADSFDSAAYEQAVLAIQVYNDDKDTIMNTLSSFDIVQEGGNNLINKYTLYTEHFTTQTQVYRNRLNWVKNRITSELDTNAMNPAEQAEIEKALADIETDNFEDDIQTAYEVGTEEIIKLNSVPTGQFMTGHETFTSQINNITDLDELNQFWDGYKALYAMAIDALDAMAQIAIPSQTPAASAIYQYRNAIMSSASALNKRAASKRASMCSIGDGWLFWIIVLILLLILGGVCFYYRREGKSTRRKSGY